MPETYGDPLFSYYNLWKVQNKKEKTKKFHTNDNNWLKLINWEIQSTLSKTDTFGTGTKQLSVRLREVSVKRESTVYANIYRAVIIPLEILQAWHAWDVSSDKGVKICNF